MDALLTLLSWLCLLSGAFLVVVAGVGLLRLPDFYTRIHGAGVTDTLGAALILMGLAIQAGPTLTAAKLVLVFVFLALTGPTSGHALAKAAYLRGLEPWLGEQRGGGGDGPS